MTKSIFKKYFLKGKKVASKENSINDFEQGYFLMMFKSDHN